MGKRVLSVLGRDFDCIIGNSVTCIWDDRGKKYVVTNPAIKGVSPDTFERGQRKKTSDGMVTPKEVCDWIEDHF